MAAKGERSKGRPARTRRERLLSPLTRRILAVNLIALLIPIGGLLYLGPYRDNLIQAEMESLRTLGDIFAGALGEGAIHVAADGQEVLNLVAARHIVRRLSRPTDVRARLFLLDGELIADSHRMGTIGGPIEVERLPPPTDIDEVINPILDMMDRAVMMLGEIEIERHSASPPTDARSIPEVRAALEGDTAGYVRQTADGRLVLSLALPVQRYYRVYGALKLSKGGEEIEAAMRDVRTTILRVFAAALVITIALSLYLAGAIARPLNRLAAAAERVRRSVGRQDEQIPDMTGRGDEIGDLSGVLREMTDALRKRLLAIETFAADVSHELKNPLSSLRSAVETAARVRDPDQQKQLMAIIREDVDRLDRLITDISDASRLDAELSRAEAEPVDLATMLSTLADMHSMTANDEAAPRPVMTAVGDGPFVVLANESRLVQVFRNLISNAISFSPPGGRIDLIVRREGDSLVATVEDEGPGIPPAKLEDVFNRFYSERPDSEQFGKHSGLGLSISKQIVEAHGGEIRAENRPVRTGDGQDNAGRTSGGARFVVRLPAAEAIKT